LSNIIEKRFNPDQLEKLQKEHAELKKKSQEESNRLTQTIYSLEDRNKELQEQIARQNETTKKQEHTEKVIKMLQDAHHGLMETNQHLRVEVEGNQWLPLGIVLEIQCQHCSRRSSIFCYSVDIESSIQSSDRC
jgi:hypothetical protein